MKTVGGVLVRPGTRTDLEAIARVHVDAWRTTYRGIVPDPVLDTLSVDQRIPIWMRYIGDDNPHFTPASFLIVAESEMEGIVGFAAAGPDRDDHSVCDAELHAIYILERAQGRGVGRRMMKYVALRLVQASCHTLKAWVLIENPARQFYWRLGGLETTRRHINIGGRSLEEVAIVWRSLDTLIRAASS